MRTTPLSLEQHLICLGIGMFSLIQGVLIKLLLPARFFNWVRINDEPMVEPEKSITSFVRKPTLNKSLNRSASKIADSHR